MGKSLQAITEDGFVIADDELKDRLEAFLEEGFEVRELVLMSLVCDKGFNGRKGPTAYSKRLEALGVKLTPGQVTTILRKKEFVQACNRLVGEIILDVGMWDVLKNIVEKASDRKDPQAVQAARLLFQATGRLKTNNEPIHTPETDPFARLVHEMRPGKVTISERRVEVEVDDGPPLPGPSPTREGKDSERGDESDSSPSIVDNSSPGDDS